MPRNAVLAFGRFALALLLGTSLIFLAKNAHDRARAGGTKAPMFETDVQPILQASCVRCHGDKRRGDLDLRTFSALMKGGESGPAVIAGKADKSLLYKKIHEGAMPADKKGMLKPDQIALIRRWIDAGAPSASGSGAAVVEVTQHDVEPILAMRCAVCHGLRKQEGGLDVRTKASLLKGGKSGPAIVLGKPAESLLLKKIHSGAMPPNKRLIEASVKPMTPTDIEFLTKWIKAGAPEVRIEPDVATTEPDPLVSDKDRQHWAFQAPKPVAVPKSPNAKRVRNPIDAFILAKLQAKGLDFAPEADALTLLRRATFDLTGLPPSPEEVEQYLKDCASDKSESAYERLIDRLLASPRYGERWGRYWLDLAGYSDSEGKRSADPIRPHAWRYRDYVIRAFNADKPYDRFLLEQLAGDELADYENAPVITQEIMDNLVATGFLRMTPDGTGSDVVNFTPERIEVISDEIQVFGASVLGLTLHCARCHSHKYDPIPQRDYYRLADIFKGAFDEHDWLSPAGVPGQAKKRPPRVLPFVSAEEKDRAKRDGERIQREIDALMKLKANSRMIDQQIKTLQATKLAVPGIRALWDRGEPSPTYIYRRGDYLQPTKLVGPGVPSVLTDGKTPFVVTPPWPGAKSTGRRLALAKWLTQPDHPLTARVMVNRIWKHHFGAGIVRSLDNFGNTGDRPSHPELLDWLAREFVQPSASRERREGTTPAGSSTPSPPTFLPHEGEGSKKPWSIKQMHRVMMLSSAYRQASTVTEKHEKLDPENRLLSRMPLKRMEAEAIYDTLLLVSGKLDETRFGVPDAVTVRADGLVTAVKADKGWRRSIYVRQRRTQIPTLLETFDLPQMNPNCIDRVDSTVAPQALFLRNNALVQELASAFGERVEKAAGTEPSKQVEEAYRIALNRPPSAEERQIGVQALAQLTEQWARETKGDQEAAARRALAAYCHTILNSAAFVYID